MKENDLELSGEKTQYMFDAFNNGENPNGLPQLELDGQTLKSN